MRSTHYRSSALHTWSVFDTVVGFIIIVFGLLAAFAGEHYGLIFFGCGVVLVIIAPILNGLSTLVENAEDQILERRQKQAMEENTL